MRQETVMVVVVCRGFESRQAKMVEETTPAGQAGILDFERRTRQG
jgi:hypothetical protein